MAVPNEPEFFFTPADDEHVKREKAKARSLRQSQWWKNRKATGRCHYCDRSVHPTELTMDHVVPIIRGGKTSRGNCVPCCKECNSRKRHQMPVELLWSEEESSPEPTDRAAGQDEPDRPENRPASSPSPERDEP